MSTEIVYRSTHPDVLAAWHKAQEQGDDIFRRRRALLDELGFEGRSALVAERHILGVEHLAEHGPIPEGWRRDRRTESAIVPALRTALGKRIEAQFNELTMPNLRAKLGGGMPEMAHDHDAGRAYWPALNLFDGAVYARWRCDPEAIEKGDRIDADFWERVKLSEYYAVLEAEEAAAALSSLPDTNKGETDDV